ncbi:MAG: hypothetical protein AEth_00873 [Candidatus Argoarchaeum ethanivorans]|uniref:Uncharacterized protein n=1 Tax=Candidatus Argoarchaeum ethanivorans TaxID=2608793 RepID=A0A8B3S2X5_9EURY|nr:MAG: hypothetical protein AEth_00873 [Candidatus Argoarchaeum ethanivorans]
MLRILVLAELGEWINQGEVLYIFGLEGLDFPDLSKRVKSVKLEIYEKAQQIEVTEPELLSIRF